MNLPIEADNLREIIERKFNLKLIDKRRHTRFIQARCIFSNILKQKGYGCLAIGNMLRKNHATILKYFENFDWFYKTDEFFYQSYEQINEQFQSNSVIYTQLQEFELKKQLILLQKENKSLYLRNQNLEKELSKLKESKVMYLESKM
tara:strand:- start:7276 stop:7716 length:441 start_codon:yes stop_codon:yes gene_type:complete